MSIYQGKKTYNNYPYSHNQLSADNPFRYMGLSYNPYLPKGVSQSDSYEKYSKKKETTSPYEKENKNKEKTWNRNSSTSLINNSYNIINNNSYNNKNFAYLKKQERSCG